VTHLDIYLTGVGGQGIGLLSEVLLRAADHAGFPVKGVDTHGLAQRGGVVVSHIRLGESAHSPLISTQNADMVIALERHEAFRGLNGYLKDGGTLIYYDAVWQPLDVRLKVAGEVTDQMIREQCGNRNIEICKVFRDAPLNPRMQNIVLLAHINRRKLITGVETDHYIRAMGDLMEGEMLARNVHLFREESADPG